MPILFYAYRYYHLTRKVRLRDSEVASGGGGGGGQRGRAPLMTACAPLPISVYSNYFFEASRNDKTTGNNGKRNNNVQG